MCASRALVGEPDDDADAMLFLAALAFSPDRVALEPPATHDGWRVAGATPRGTKLELTFAVKQQNMDALEARLLRTSDPKSAEYGRHMTNEAVHALTAPLAAHSEMVRIFAGRFGATATPATPNGDMVTVTVDVETAERMLGAKYFALCLLYTSPSPRDS